MFRWWICKIIIRYQADQRSTPPSLLPWTFYHFLILICHTYTCICMYAWWRLIYVSLRKIRENGAERPALFRSFYGRLLIGVVMQLFFSHYFWYMKWYASSFPIIRMTLILFFLFFLCRERHLLTFIHLSSFFPHDFSFC